MPLDHSKANVTISIAGLALSCINKLMQNRCEVGILRCERHKPILDIQRIELDPCTGKPVRSSLVHHSLNLDEDILITVEYPDADQILNCQRGTSTYMRREFDRLDDTGDYEDFRWIANLEGPEFHNRKLKIKHKYKLSPTIFISDGTLYTTDKTEEALARVSIKGESSPVPLGKFAHGMSADITIKDGGELVLSNRCNDESQHSGDCCSVRLPSSDYTKYLITLENHCKVADESEGTDFRLFYEVVRDSREKEFDLRRIVETGCYATPEEKIGERMDFSLDGFPQNCLTVFLGVTQNIKD
jgi:hypothetical protein